MSATQSNQRLLCCPRWKSQCNAQGYNVSRIWRPPGTINESGSPLIETIESEQIGLLATVARATQELYA